MTAGLHNTLPDASDSHQYSRHMVWQGQSNQQY